MVEPQSRPRSIGAHLVPGVLAFFFYVAASRVLVPRGLPPSFALFLAMLVVLIPYEVGALVHASKKKAGEGARDLIPYKARLPVLQYAVLVPVLLAWAFFCFFAVAPHEEGFFARTFFPWPPAWLVGAGPGASTAAWVATLAFGLVVNGLALPLVEELYFRGYRPGVRGVLVPGGARVVGRRDLGAGRQVGLLETPRAHDLSALPRRLEGRRLPQVSDLLLDERDLAEAHGPPRAALRPEHDGSGRVGGAPVRRALPDGAVGGRRRGLDPAPLPPVDVAPPRVERTGDAPVAAGPRVHGPHLAVLPLQPRRAALREHLRAEPRHAPALRDAADDALEARADEALRGLELVGGEDPAVVVDGHDGARERHAAEAVGRPVLPLDAGPRRHRAEVAVQVARGRAVDEHDVAARVHGQGGVRTVRPAVGRPRVAVAREHAQHAVVEVRGLRPRAAAVVLPAGVEEPRRRTPPRSWSTIEPRAPRE
jgi:hypothetical protein